MTMKTFQNSLIAGFMLLLPGTTLQAAGFEDSNITHVEFPDWFIDSPFLELGEDLKKARANGKQGLMVLYTTDGCSYCGIFIRDQKIP